MRLNGILVLSIFLFSFHGIPCFSNARGIYDASLYDVRANPTYYGALDGKESEIDEHPNGFIMQSIDGVGVGLASSIVVNVGDYGAQGDGSDATNAFLQAWSKVCSSSSAATFMVPANKNYLLKPITFYGPCKSNVTMLIEGTIQASPDRSDWDGKNPLHWILINGVNNLHVTGGGTINGNGEIWWKNSCKINKSLPCKVAPTAITFYSCNELVVDNLHVQNSQQIHMQFEESNNVRATSISISAPSSSPNTDGIHITSTKNIHLDHINIGTGDDCISIVDGAQGVIATNISCGPGHGISIGSLGDDKAANYVSDVTVDTAQLKGTMNGVRIKTWQGGSGYAKHIRFQNIHMNNVENPIIIDQNYCDSNEPCPQQSSAVQVSDVTYKNIWGTSASKVAINLECSKNVPCQQIVLQNINLVEASGGATASSCQSVQLTDLGTVIPRPCA